MDRRTNKLCSFIVVATTGRGLEQVAAILKAAMAWHLFINIVAAKRGLEQAVADR